MVIIHIKPQIFQIMSLEIDLGWWNILFGIIILFSHEDVDGLLSAKRLIQFSSCQGGKWFAQWIWISSSANNRT